MKFRALAKHAIYECARGALEFNEHDARWLTPDRHEFTPRQLEKFREAVNEELLRMRQKLVDQKIIEG